MKTAVVLSGGGSLGAFEAGALKALENANIDADIIAGTSAGALNAAGLAIGLNADQIADIWRRTRRDNVIKIRRDYQKIFDIAAFRRGHGKFRDKIFSGIAWDWLFDTAPLEETLTSFVGEGDANIIEGKTVIISAVDMLTAQLVRYTNRLPPGKNDRFQEVKLGVKHLLASASIPILFKPADVDGRLMWDGGLIANTPLKAAMAYQPDRVFVISASPLSVLPKKPQSLGEAVSLLFNSLLHHGVLGDLRRAVEMNELCADADHELINHKRCVELILIQPVADHTTGLLDFSASSVEHLLAEGEQEATKVLAERL